MGMPEIRLTLMGPLGRLAGERETRLHVDESATVRDLLTLLAERYGLEFAEAIFRAPGEVHTHLRAFIDEQDAELEDRIARDGGAPAAVAVLIVPGFEGGSR
jgi:hypothetical protein